MSLKYTIATDGARITLALTRGSHLLAEIKARPEEGADVLISTAQNWRNTYPATPKVQGPPELWAALPPLFRQTLDECVTPAKMAA